ncbi:MAG: maleylpyruvate isomerase N-terminal domain-containing protein, partial [Anaerolineales bacterium]
MTDRKEPLRETLETAHQASWSVLIGLSTEEYNVRVYGEGADGWTVRDVVAHLADAERGLLRQARRVTQGDAGVPSDFDRDRWNRSAVRRKAS